MEVIEPVAADEDPPALLPREAEDEVGARLSLLAALERFLSLSRVEVLLLLSLYEEGPLPAEGKTGMPSSEENVTRGSV